MYVVYLNQLARVLHCIHTNTQMHRCKTTGKQRFCLHSMQTMKWQKFRNSISLSLDRAYNVVFDFFHAHLCHRRVMHLASCEERTVRESRRAQLRSKSVKPFNLLLCAMCEYILIQIVIILCSSTVGARQRIRTEYLILIAQR